MITIKARINLTENGGAVDWATTANDGTKISSSIGNVVGKKSQPKIVYPFFFGYSRLGEQHYTYMTEGERAPYYMGKRVSNNNGIFGDTYTINIYGSNITQFIIIFDTANGAYPQSIEVDGKTYSDDDAIYEIINLNSAAQHTISISNWNKPNSPLIITAIYADLNIEIDQDNLISSDDELFDRSNTTQPSYGLISNTANLTVADYNEQILDLITQKVLGRGIKVTVWVNNDKVAERNQVISEKYIQSITYDNDNKQAQISLKDNIETMQDVNVPAIYIDVENIVSKTGKYYYDHLYTKSQDAGLDVLAFNELDNDTKSVLNNTVIQYPILDEDSLWNEWTKLCDLCLLHIYVNANNRVVVTVKKSQPISMVG